MSQKKKPISKQKIFIEKKPQTIFLLFVVLILVVINFFYWEIILRIFGWGSIIVISYSLVSLFIILFQNKKFTKYWRYWVFGIFISLASIGFLGLFNAPVDLESSNAFTKDNQNYFLTTKELGDTLGGNLGDIISREPQQWEHWNNIFALRIFGVFRNIIILLIGFSICWPKKMLLVLKKILIYSKFTYLHLKKWYISFFNLINSKSSNNTDSQAEENNKILEDQVEEKEILNDESLIKEPKVEQKITTTLNNPSEKWILPNIEILNESHLSPLSNEEMETTKKLIVSTLKEHGIEVTVGQVKPGPTVTMYGLEPGYGKKSKSKTLPSNKEQIENQENLGTRVRVDTILSREKDLALALASPNLRFQAPVPGTSLVGIEVPNKSPSLVNLRTTMETKNFSKFNKNNPLPLALGIGSNGDPVYCDLTKMPHFLVAGATGSGKSVCINSMISGLLLVRDPSELRLIMIDPKRVELTPYSGIPHLYTDPIVDAAKAVSILKLVIDQMMDRFKTLESLDCKNIAAFNEKSEEKLPYLVIIVDELADLMLSAAGEVEKSLVRIAQLGRATGIHLIVATQRPSVDVVTGLIKANFPSRISFSVTSQIDSRTVIDSPGAEKLLGRGDMLFLPVDQPKAIRVQGGLLSESEINSIISHWKDQSSFELPKLNPETKDESTSFEFSKNTDALFQQAVELAISQKKLSTSLLQRRLRIGYPRAARLMDELEEEGIVGPGDSGKPRDVLKH